MRGRGGYRLLREGASKLAWRGKRIQKRGERLTSDLGCVLTEQKELWRDKKKARGDSSGVEQVWK
jgi:hypothetical protein